MYLLFSGLSWLTEDMFIHMKTRLETQNIVKTGLADDMKYTYFPFPTQV